MLLGFGKEQRRAERGLLFDQSREDSFHQRTCFSLPQRAALLRREGLGAIFKITMIVTF